jgi:hypothetical protein
MERIYPAIILTIYLGVMIAIILALKDVVL